MPLCLWLREREGEGLWEPEAGDWTKAASQTHGTVAHMNWQGLWCHTQDLCRMKPENTHHGRGRWSGRPPLAEELLAPDDGCRDEDSQLPSGVCYCDAARLQQMLLCPCTYWQHSMDSGSKTKPNKKETAHEWEGRTGEMGKELEGKEWVGLNRNTLHAWIKFSAKSGLQKPCYLEIVQN